MAKIVIVSSSKTKLKIQLSPKLTKNLIDWNIQLTVFWELRCIGLLTVLLTKPLTFVYIC